MNYMARSVEAMCNRQEVVDARGWANLELACKGGARNDLRGMPFLAKQQGVSCAEDFRD